MRAKIGRAAAALLPVDMLRTSLHSCLLAAALSAPLACGGDEDPDPAASTGSDDGLHGDVSTGSNVTASAEDTPPPEETTSGATTTDDEDPSGETGPPATGESSDGGIPAHPCCELGDGPGCAADPDAEACVCATEEGASCCTEAWDEHCVAILEHYECAPVQSPCGASVEAVPWDCDCTTTNVTCVDNPFVSQVTFFEDACSTTHLEALAYVDAYCVSGDDDCMAAPGSCDCTCELDDSPPPNACAE